MFMTMCFLAICQRKIKNAKIYVKSILLMSVVFSLDISNRSKMILIQVF